MTLTGRHTVLRCWDIKCVCLDVERVEGRADLGEGSPFKARTSSGPLFRFDCSEVKPLKAAACYPYTCEQVYGHYPLTGM
jgi:hypothetical protein